MLARNIQDAELRLLRHRRAAPSRTCSARSLLGPGEKEGSRVTESTLIAYDIADMLMRSLFRSRSSWHMKNMSSKTSHSYMCASLWKIIRSSHGHCRAFAADTWWGNKPSPGYEPKCSGGDHDDSFGDEGARAKLRGSRWNHEWCSLLIFGPTKEFARWSS